MTTNFDGAWIESDVVRVMNDQRAEPKNAALEGLKDVQRDGGTCVLSVGVSCL